MSSSSATKAATTTSVSTASGQNTATDGLLPPSNTVFTAILPPPTASGSFSSDTAILCPAANTTLYTDSGDSSHHWLVLCSRDYNSNAGAQDIIQYPYDSLARCIQNCSSTPGCVAVGWGDYFGTQTCFLKAKLGVPNVSGGWYTVVQDDAAYTPPPNSGLSPGAKAGIAVGSVVVGIALATTAFALWWFHHRRRPGGPAAAAAATARAPSDPNKPPPSATAAATSREALTDQRLGIASASSDHLGSINPLTPPSPKEKDAGSEWDWTGTGGRAAAAAQGPRSELPTRDGFRYGPEYELEDRPARRQPVPHLNSGGGVSGRDEAEQKFLASDLATARLRAEASGPGRGGASSSPAAPIPKPGLSRSDTASGSSDIMYMPPSPGGHVEPGL